MKKNQNQDISLGLERMNALMEAFHNPQQQMPVIHVAGTNGKGSTCTFLESVLLELQLKVGCYRSPAVFDPLETIQVCGKAIPKEVYQDLSEQVKKVGEKLIAQGLAAPTPFEVETTVAYIWFFQMGCDVVVVETGMGGDLDATNVTDSTIASVITPISMDHMAFLGDSLEEIAFHKSGIMKPHTPVFCAPQAEEADRVLRQRAGELDCAFYEIQEPPVRFLEDGHPAVDIEGFPACRLGLVGRYQGQNAALAVTVLKHLRQNPEGLFKGICDYRMEQAVRTGLERAQLGGRMEALEGTPELVLDGAHNPGAAAQLRLALDARYPDQPGIFVMGAFEDKNYLEVAKRVIHQEVCVMTVQAPGPRGLSAAQLKEELEPLTDHAVAAYEDVFLALQDAKMQAQVYQELHGVSPYILCFGSLSWLAGAQNAWRLLQGQTLNI